VIVIHIAIVSSEVRELYFSSFNYSAFHWKCELHSSIINNSDLFLPVEKSLGHGSVAIRRLSYTFNGGFSPLTFTNASPFSHRAITGLKVNARECNEIRLVVRWRKNFCKIGRGWVTGVGEREDRRRAALAAQIKYRLVI